MRIFDAVIGQIKGELNSYELSSILERTLLPGSSDDLKDKEPQSWVTPALGLSVL